MEPQAVKSRRVSSNSYPCQECPKLYSRQEHLARHVTAKHNVVKAFVCSVCSKGYARRDIMRRHEMAHGELALGTAKQGKVVTVKVEESTTSIATSKRSGGALPGRPAKSRAPPSQPAKRPPSTSHPEETPAGLDLQVSEGPYLSWGPPGMSPEVSSSNIYDLLAGAGSAVGSTSTLSQHMTWDDITDQGPLPAPVPIFDHSAFHPSASPFSIDSLELDGSSPHFGQSSTGTFGGTSQTGSFSDADDHLVHSDDFLGLLALSACDSVLDYWANVDFNSPDWINPYHNPTPTNASFANTSLPTDWAASTNPFTFASPPSHDRTTLSHPGTPPHYLPSSFPSDANPHSSSSSLPTLSFPLDLPSPPHSPPSPPPDPWPISRHSHDAYATASRFPSRETSPIPIELLSPPTHVPRLLPSTRERLLAFAPPHIVPPLELLNLFVQLYFASLYPLLPLIHLPSFDPNEVELFLTVTVAAIGARYAHDRVPGTALFARALGETARRMCQAACGADETVRRRPAWAQATILQLLCCFNTGAKVDLEIAQMEGSLPASLCRRQGWLKEPEVDIAFEASLSVEDRWRRWKDREEIKRVGFGTIVFDGIGTALWDLESGSTYAEAAKACLPCSDKLWAADSAYAWQKLFSGPLPPKPLGTFEAIRMVSDRSLHASQSLLAVAHDVCAMTVVITILGVIGWKRMREDEVTLPSLPVTMQLGTPLVPIREALDAGLEFFQDRILLPPDVQALLPESIPQNATLALTVHLTYMTSRLPLRLLHPLARLGNLSPSPDILSGIHAWAASASGKTARTTAWHAAQLVSLVHETHAAPLEPLALFYATLTLFCFVEVVGGGGTGEIELDKRVDRQDPGVREWVEMGGRVPVLGVVGRLDRKGAGVALLRSSGEFLMGLKVWRVGELLGRTLLQLAEAPGWTTPVVGCVSPEVLGGKN